MLLYNRSNIDGTSGVRCIVVFFIGAILFAVLCFALEGTGNLSDATANDDRVISLTPGTTVTNEVAGGTAQLFEISLHPNQLLQFSINKGDLRLSLVIHGPAGERFLEQVSNGYEVVDVSIPIDSDGIHRLEVRSLEFEHAPRPFELKINPIKSATATDRRDSAARQARASAGLLRSELTESSLRKAIAKYHVAAQIWLSLRDPRNAASAYLGAGEVHFLRGENRQALKQFQAAALAARNAGAGLEEAEAFTQVGRLQSYLGNLADAQANVGKGLDFYVAYNGGNRPPMVKRAYAVALNALGEVDYSKGNLVKSSKDFEDSLKLFQEIGDRGGQARAHLFLGYINGGLGEPEKAGAEISQALALSRAVAEKNAEGLSLTALGLSHSLKRDEENAIRLHREAREIFRAIGNKQSEAITLNAVGQSYKNLSQYEIALNNHREALELSKEGETLDFAAVINYQIADVYRLIGDRPHALFYYEQCLRLSRSTKNKRAEANALNQLAAIYALQGDKKKTLAQYEEILKFYRSTGDRRGQSIALNNLGDFLLRQGEKTKALALYMEALPFSEQVGEKGAIISTLYNIARAMRDTGALDDALSYIRRSIKTIEDMRANVSTPDFRTSYFAGIRRHYDLYIDILMQLDRARPGQGFAAAGLVASESARARSLVDVLTEARADIRQGVDPKVLQREHELQGMLRSQARYQMELSINGRETSEATEVASQMDQLMAEYQEIQSRIRTQNPRFLALTQPASLGLEEIQGELRDGNTILLEYALGDERSYLWAVTADSLLSYELPPRTVLEDAGREVYQLITARQEIGGRIDAEYQAKVEASDRAYNEKALRLSRMLLGPVAAQLGNRRLLVVTEGLLQYVPLDPLPAPDTPSAEQNGKETLTNSGDPQLLISAHEIVTLPSVSTLAAIRREQRRVSSRNKIVAVLADPVFSNDDNRVQSGAPPNAVAAADSNQGPSRPVLRGIEDLRRNTGATRLGHASEEADAILAVTPRGTGMVAKGFDASREAAMSSLVGQYQIVHFATHGFLNSERPELSGIVLTMVNRDGSSADGFMSLQDIYGLELSCDLTVLSACDTALGKSIKGEGLVGLTRGFMFAGSRSVVASLWKVDDRATAVLMAHFYKAMLEDGMPPAAALRAAKESMRQQGAWKPPYFWAGFVLQGEYKERIVVDRTSWLRTGLAISLALILISCGLIILKRRRNAGRVTTVS